MIKLVVFDLDNVIIDGEAIDEIGKLANVEDEIAEITEKAMQGEIDFETSIKDRVKLLEGTSIEDIQKVADELPLMNGAEDTIARLKEEGLDVAIISGSFDVVAQTVKDKLGIENAYTNSFTVEDGKLTGEVTGPLVSGSKLDVLKEHIEGNDTSLEEVVAVGDGANDISMIESAGIGIAFNAKDSVKEKADVVVDEKDLTKVLDEIINQLSTDVVEDDETEQVEEAEDAEESTEEAEKPKKDGLPESDFVLADTMEGVRKQKDEKEAEIAKVTEEREEFNRIAKEQRKIRDELNASLKENLNKAIEFRNERNEINKKVEEAKKAQADGADYLGVGAMYATNTKTDARAVTKEQLVEIRAAVDIPIVIIGGVNQKTVPNFKGMGIDGAAVVSAVVSQPDIEKAAKDLRELCEDCFGR